MKNKPVLTGKNARFIIPLYILFLLIQSGCSDLTPENNEIPESFQYIIPTGGNSWVIHEEAGPQEAISDSGIIKWSDPDKIIRTYFRISEVTDLKIAIRVKTSQAASELKTSFNGNPKNIRISNTAFDTLMIGKFNVEKPGYQYIEFEKPEGGSHQALDITHILLNGIDTDQKVHYVSEDFYWGRRGPSVHLNYEKPENTGDVLWFYNEVTIPEPFDVIGSFYMANGFSHGYFGMQVNGPDERRILFSVWSPYETDDPGEIPEESRVKLLRKGEDVYAGKFGNEGSGGQSYLKYNWKAGNTYRFLLKGEPNDNATTYTAWFFTPEDDEWKLIASFRRPKTSTYLKRLHSFLENFRTETGYLTRKGYYSNQWVCDNEGSWHELTRAKFTADATARKGERLDYTGGTESDKFYLKNCGFFDENQTIGKMLERKPSENPPAVDLSLLEQ